MKTKPKILGATVAVAVGMALQGCASVPPEHYVYRTVPYGPNIEPVLQCSGINNGIVPSSYINYVPEGSGSRTGYLYPYRGYANSCKGYGTFYRDNQVACAVVGYVDP